MQLEGEDGTSYKTALANAEAIKELPEPKNVSEVRSFLGLITSVKNFLKHLSQLVPSIRRLLKEGLAFKWSPTCAKIFEEVK